MTGPGSKAAKAFAAAALLAAGANAAQAAIIYGSPTTNGTGSFTRYDTVTDTTTIISSISGNMGLTFDASDNLWGVKGTSLFSVDINTGTATLVGTASISAFIEAATFDLNGRLLAAESGASPDVYAFDTGTGSATLVGSISGMSDVDGLTVAPVEVATSIGTLAAGTLFAADSGNVYAIDPVTLVATLLHSGTTANETLAFGADGTLYTNNASSGYFELDLVSGTSTSLGGPGVWGSAVLGALAGTGPTPAPAPATLALMAVGVLGAVRAARRR